MITKEKIIKQLEKKNNNLFSVECTSSDDEFVEAYIEFAKLSHRLFNCSRKRKAELAWLLGFRQRHFFKVCNILWH